MTPDKLSLLEAELSNLESAAEHLRVSLERTRGLFGGQSWQLEDLERLESLASRFARLSDLLTQRIMRLVDELELLGGTTQLDRIRRAEKRGWIDDASTLIRILELRNLIAHEYAADRLAEIYTAVATLTPDLLTIVPRATTYARKLIATYLTPYP